jgi:baculoviral IAP repeat-containing protein 5
MAEAGFYYSGISDDDDSATCFVCGKVLDGWERHDNPMSEHEKHAPNCHFVRKGKSQEAVTVSSNY